MLAICFSSNNGSTTIVVHEFEIREKPYNKNSTHKMCEVYAPYQTFLIYEISSGSNYCSRKLFFLMFIYISLISEY